MSNGTIEYQVMQIISWYKKLKKESPEFIADISATIRNVNEVQLCEYAKFCNATLHEPFEILPCYWLSRRIDSQLTIHIHSTEMKKETIYKPIM